MEIKNLTENAIAISFLHAIRLKDYYLFEHSVLVGLIAREVTKAMGMQNGTVESIYIAGLLHDIGKIAVREDILKKPSALNKMEWEQMKMHPVLGANCLAPFPEMDDIARFIMQHHERSDGSGYPFGLKAEQICFESGILHICDSFAAMTVERPYKPLYPSSYAARMSLTSAGFDHGTAKLIEQRLLLIDSRKLLYTTLGGNNEDGIKRH